MDLSTQVSDSDSCSFFVETDWPLTDPCIETSIADERETAIIIPTNSRRLLRHATVLAILATFTAASYAAGDVSSSTAPADTQVAQATAPAPPPAAAPAPAPAAAPAPLSTFVLTGPLQWLPPATFDAGPLGKLSVNGIITGFAQFQNNSVPGDASAQATLSNGQIFIQKADGNFQYYIQAGAYALPTLSVPFVNAANTTNNLYGPVPVAFAKLLAGKTTQFEISSLPTLMGAESTFTYQNFNIERGIIWNQENAINRGIQINQTLGKYLAASVSWNDGYYSNRYNDLSGSITFTKGPHVLVYDGNGNLGRPSIKQQPRRYRTMARCTP